MRIIKGLTILAFLLFTAGPSAMSQEGRIILPPGFNIEVYASGLRGPRFMALSPGGVLFVSLLLEGEIMALPDKDGDGRADKAITFAEGLDRPHGLAFRAGFLYVAETGRVLRLWDKDADLRADGRETIVREIPPGGGHWTRTLGFGPDGGLYVSVGSSCNVCEEDDERRATILRFNPDGSGGRIFAQGLRNAVGFRWHPRTGELWATENGRDWLGDDLPPDELNRVREGGHYGWPYCFGQRVPDPEYEMASFCRKTVPAAFEFQAHSAPLGLAFYTGDMFPREYRGDLFVAFHGSWNRTVPTGYKVVRVRFKGGEPIEQEDFATGWLVEGKAWGRPVDLLVGRDGALYLTDDRGGRIYRITHGR